MKKFITSLSVVVLLVGIVFAQDFSNKQITAAQYWLDNSSAANAVSLSGITYHTTNNGDTISASFGTQTVDISSLSQGLHVIYVRMKDTKGNWGQPTATSFLIGSFSKKGIQKVRYWFDNPAPTNAVEISATPTYNSDSTIASWNNQSITAPNTAGLHKLYASIQDAKGNWGSPIVTSFNVGDVPAKTFITQGQYWFNSPTPTGNAVTVNPTYNSDSTVANFSNIQVDASSLSNGQHKIYFRTLDSKNRWSVPSFTMLTVGGETKKTVAKGEYWFNSATPTNAVEIASSNLVIDKNDSSKVSANLSNVAIPSGLPNGKYTLYIRFQDSKGKWGQAQPIQFVQDASLAPPTISSMEYFFGNIDPGTGSASGPRTGTISGIGGRSVSYSDTFSVASLGLPLGANKFSVRFKSSKNEWGPTIAQQFSVLTRPELVGSKDTIKFISTAGQRIYSNRDSIKTFVWMKNKGDADLKVKVKQLPSTQWKIRFGANEDKDSVTILKTETGTPVDSQIAWISWKPVQQNASTVTNTLQFTTNDSVKSFQYNLPVLFKADSAIGQLATSVDTLNFGSVSKSTQKTMNLVISNIGVDSIVVSTSTISNPVPTSYSFTAATITSRRLGYKTTDTILYPVTFKPLVVGGAWTSSFTITVNNRNGNFLSSKTIFVRGTGIDIQNPTIATSTTSLDFGSISARAQDAKDTTLTFTVTNLGIQQLTVNSIVSSDTSVFKVISPTSSFTVNTNVNQNVSVMFKPTIGVYKTYSANVTINNSSPDSNSALKISMKGEATQGPPLSVLQLSTTSLNYGSITIGYSDTRPVTITNKGGNKNLTISALNFSNSNFSTTQTVPFTVLPESSKTFDVKYYPATIGTDNGTLDVVSNATVNASQKINLTGNCVATPQPIISLSQTAVSFSVTKVNSTSEIMLKITNTGNLALQTSSVSVLTGSVFSINKSTLPNLAPGASDSIKIEFKPIAVSSYVDSLIITSNAPRKSIPLTGSGAVLAISVDTNSTPPVISAGLPQTVVVNLTANMGASSYGYLFFKLAGAPLYDSLLMTKSANGITFSGTIPANKIGERGSVYYVKISNGIETVVMNPNYVAVTYPTGIEKPQVQPIGKAQNFYRMISVPADGISGTVTNVLGKFGAYDKNNWRLFRYNTALDKYVEHSQAGFESFAPGRGYWFITTISGKLQSGVGKSTASNKAFDIDLQPGWNQIGNPFSFAVPWDSVTGRGSVVGVAYSYSGSDYQTASVLKPWEGFFVKNQSSSVVTIHINPIESTVPITIGKISADGIPVNLKSGEWMMQLKANAGIVSDEFNFIGEREDASEEFDMNDVVESPLQPGEYLKLSFNRRNWQNYGDKYGYDFRPISKNGRYWDFELHTNTTEDAITLTADKFNSVPKNYSLYLIDKGGKVAYDLRKQSEVSIPSLKKESLREYRILIGTKDFVEQNSLGVSPVPSQFVLNQNYPNPFNPSTMVKFELPQTSKVTVKVFDILGKEIKTLINDIRGEGYYVVSWDATDNNKAKVSSGVYLCKIEAQSIDGAKNYINTIKMILTK